MSFELVGKRHWDNQVALIAVGFSRTDAVLGYLGYGISSALLYDNTTKLDDPREQFPAAGYPTKPGLYVWRGTVTFTEERGPVHPELGYREPFFDFEISGAWQSATPGEAAWLLGAAEPPIGHEEVED